MVFFGIPEPRTFGIFLERKQTTQYAAPNREITHLATTTKDKSIPYIPELDPIQASNRPDKAAHQIRVSEQGYICEHYLVI